MWEGKGEEVKMRVEVGIDVGGVHESTYPGHCLHRNSGAVLERQRGGGGRKERRERKGGREGGGANKHQRDVNSHCASCRALWLDHVHCLPASFPCIAWLTGFL